MYLVTYKAAAEAKLAKKYCNIVASSTLAYIGLLGGLLSKLLGSSC